MSVQQAKTSLDTTNLADLLERILDKGVMIAGDIKVSLCDIELLTVQIRLIVCSVDKAREMGMDWWANNPAFSPSRRNSDSMDNLNERLERIEARLGEPGQ